MQFYPTRIGCLAAAAPYLVIEEDGQLYAAPIANESVHNLMGVVDALTEKWAEENGFTYENISVSPEVLCPTARFFLEGFKLPKGWVTT